MEKERMNVAEILRNCQAGMSLDCVCFDNVVFDRVDDKNRIRCFVGSQRDEVSFNEYGCLNGSPSAKCVIFPVGETSWEVFQKPKLKVGDWVVNIDGKVNQVVAIDDNCDGFTLDDGSHCNNAWNKLYRLWTIQDAKEGDVLVHNRCTFVFMGIKDDIVQGICTEIGNTILNFGNAKYDNDYCPATKEQRDLLFQKMNDAGYTIDFEKKELKKLITPNFKVGDVIQDEDSYTVTITEVVLDDECYVYESVIAKGIGSISFSEQSKWKLVKFDINTLVPFESRVLVRDLEEDKWKPAIFGYYIGKPDYCVLGGTCWLCCIPFEGNEHLIGKTDDCADYFKTWK